MLDEKSLIWVIPLKCFSIWSDPSYRIGMVSPLSMLKGIREMWFFMDSSNASSKKVSQIPLGDRRMWAGYQGNEVNENI